MTSPRTAATLVAATLTFDGLLHVYWSTGSTWPARTEPALSQAVLGLDAPFTPPVVLPLAALLFTASGVVVTCARRPGARLPRLGTAAVAAGLALRGAAGLYWIAAKDPGTAFYWLNLGLYTPLCGALALAAARVARQDRGALREDAVRA
ncbi:DUF3995 domain-containing protein [Streptomyces sp. VRA16 Mangrove soil]|uniref:DUF3995 domain-containing protein n=1 Tax=Streptomyces sp. VRA16 Mangrove soil TaxID=2817434 RepID=UPI001A9DDF26|nr:DUF3995 domain-containing protein [Streptomyces sp. VRA16 Mangrove soil]MBO1334044.1 DUF3995 domain-containing protein [Streptomyces sp. VRA16 Mangrove soil]